MTSIVSWHGKLDKNKVAEMIQKNFSPEKVLFVMEELADLAGLDKPQRHVNSVNRTALSLYAEELVKMLNEVINHRPEKLPDYVVVASDLHLLPVESLTEAEVSLAVRMDMLEKAVQELVKKPQVAVQEVARELASKPQEVVQEQARRPQEGALGAALVRGRTLSYRRVAAGGRAATPARAAGAEPARGAERDGRAEVPNGKRPRTDEENGMRGQERPRNGEEGPRRQGRPRQEDEDGYRRQGRPRQQLAQRQRKVAQGSSQVDLSDVLGVAAAAPLDFYVGNTSLDVTEDDVKQVLVRCATDVQGNTAHLEVLEVKEIGTDLANRKTKCWKVKVPFKMKELMQQSSLYPSGWTHRRFFEQRNKNVRTVPVPAPAAALPGRGAGASVTVPVPATAAALPGGGAGASVAVPGAAAAAVSGGEVLLQEASQEQKEVLCEQNGNFL
jgi:hypothetical protein